jgi:hypothetical protein
MNGIEHAEILLFGVHGNTAFLRDPSYRGYTAVHKPAFLEWQVNFLYASKDLLGRLRVLSLGGVRCSLAHKLLIKLLDLIRLRRRDVLARGGAIGGRRSGLDMFATDDGSGRAGRWRGVGWGRVRGNEDHREHS